jgi:AmmeMemoRadiSam system protein B
VDAVAARLGDAAFRAEIVHRDEHSIEFQAVYLKHRFGDHPLTMVPILCGGFHALIDQGKTPREEPQFEALIAAVREAERTLGGDTVYVAGADLSHVGPRFGDPPIDARTKEVEAIDRGRWRRRATPKAFASIAAHQDSSRICATAGLRRCAAPPPAPGGSHLRAVGRKDSSMVSTASMAWSTGP